MRWILFLALVTAVIVGCDEESPDAPPEASAILLVEAPTRLPFTVSWSEQPYETTQVRFIAKLDVIDTEIDSIFVRVHDDQGTKIDSFVLYDDGNLIEHWAKSTCESSYSGDSLERDGLYSRVIKPWEFTANYVGATYSFVFTVEDENKAVAQAVHIAETWEPTLEVLNVNLSTTLFPPCEDSVVVELTVRSDSADAVENVALGFNVYRGHLSGHVIQCVPLSGDSIWQAVIQHDDEMWIDLSFGSGFHADLSTRLGGIALVSLVPHYEHRDPVLDLSMVPDTFQIHSWSTPESLLVRVRADLCENRSLDRINTWYNSPYGFYHWTFGMNFYNDNMNDCGVGADEVADDHIFSGYIVAIADTLAPALTQNLSFGSAIARTFTPCSPAYDIYGGVSAHKPVTFLPPQ